MPEPTFDEDGYPTEDTLRTLRVWPALDGIGALEFLREAWKYPERISLVSAVDDIDGTVEDWHLSTGGWSGNEELLGALKENFVWWSTNWYSHRRGGHYVFRPRKRKVPDVVDVLSLYRFRTNTERDLQRGVAEALMAAGIRFEAEYRLEGELGIIDFWLPDTRQGIECKIKGTLNDVTRQLYRYAESEQIASLILLSAKVKLCRNLPRVLLGKTVRVLSLWKTCL